MQPIRVAIVDVSEMGRHGLRSLLQSLSLPIEIVEEFSSIDPLESWLQTKSIDVIILSDETPRSIDIPYFLKKLGVLAVRTKFVVLSQRLNLDYIQRLINSGVRGFVFREDKLLDKLQSALVTVINGELYLSPRASALPFVNSSGRPNLTNRDLQVLRLMAQDYPVQEIADTLAVTKRVVYRSRERLRHALGVRTSEQIVGAAMEAGLLRDG
jgi:DNA-binding NarL/FixJ family response regulator